MKIKISILILLALASCVFAASVVNSPHNLTVNGTGDVKAATEQNVCVFLPHAASRERLDAVVESFDVVRFKLRRLW